MSERRIELKCEFCTSSNLRAFVQHGSYFLRCISCSQSHVATSWLALSSEITESLRATVVSEEFQEIEFLAEGVGPNFISKVSKAAYAGELVMLTSSSKNA
ncbi:hypothetical protein KSS92_12620 [Pseudomonas atacamensis]|uniref:hypothetical protein n=1 Tax=Pseudomonas atacamensis TaxID=2565368 RepID=UPI001C3E6984|nr:hypothetical protein [Pseudomonas atacamensis]QXH75283.1 hypothetical protein KSS92_12620 [Pseudomonas atacamensis]